MCIFCPDDTIFEETVFDYDVLKQRFRETAFLTKGLKINLADLREGMEQEHSLTTRAASRNSYIF